MNILDAPPVARALADRLYSVKDAERMSVQRVPGRRLRTMPRPPVLELDTVSAITGGVFTGFTLGGAVRPVSQLPFDFGNRNDQMDTVRNVYPTAGYPNVYPWNASIVPSLAKGAPANIYYNSNWYRLRTMTDAPVIEFIGLPAQSQSDSRFYVDGLLAGTVPSNAGATYSVFRLRLGSRKMRVIEVEGGVFWTGVTIDNQSVLEKPPALGGPKVAWLGDSVLQGTGADVGQTGYGYQCSRIMGWDRVSMHAQGGTGYTSNLGGALQTFIQRVPAIIAEKPDVVIVAGGYNDGDDAVTWSNAVLACFQALRAGLPDAKLIFVGPWGNIRSGRYAMFLQRWQTVYPLLTAVPGLVNGMVDTIQTLGPWFTGTGWSGSPMNDGNSDMYVWTDGIHFTQDGHDYAAQRLAAWLSRILGFQSTEPHPDVGLLPMVDVASAITTLIPKAGQTVFETDSLRTRQGDGVTPVASLPMNPKRWNSHGAARWHPINDYALPIAVVGVTDGLVLYVPWDLDEPMTIDQWGVTRSVIGVGGAQSISCALYRASSISNLPSGGPVLGLETLAPPIDLNTGGASAIGAGILSASLTIPPGRYYVATKGQKSGTPTTAATVAYLGGQDPRLSAPGGFNFYTYASAYFSSGSSTFQTNPTLGSTTYYGILPWFRSTS